MLAAERYKSVWNMFLQALNHDPTACLVNHQYSVPTIYQRVSHTSIFE